MTRHPGRTGARRPSTIAASFVAHAVAVFAALLAAPGPANAQDFPSRQIRFVVTLAPGGPLDLFARLVGGEIQKSTGQTVVVENRPGAASRIAVDALVKAPADGYTVLVAGGSITTLPVFVKNLGFDVAKDLAPVTIGAEAQQVVFVSSRVPATTIAEFVKHAKSNPGAVNYGSLGRTPGMLAVEAFSRMAGIRMSEVPYKNTPEMFNGLARGDIQFVLTSYELLTAQMAAGAVRPLAVVGNLRLKSPPDIPALSELGFGALRMPGWYALFVRSQTPRPVLDTLYRESAKALQVPEVAAKIEATGARVNALRPDESRERMLAEIQLWSGIAKEINLQPE